MVKTRDWIIVLVFMAAVTLLNASVRRGEGIAAAVDGIWKNAGEKRAAESEMAKEAVETAGEAEEPGASDGLKTMESEEISGIPALSEADLEAMQQQAAVYITEESDLWSVASLVGYEYIGNYILQGKEKRYGDQIYLVNRVWMVVEEELENITPYYHLVKFSSVTLGEDGKWKINPAGSTPENGNYYLQDYALTYVEGYGSVEELYEAVVKGQLEQYECKEDIDEDKAALRNFEEINFADMKWAEEFEEASMSITGGTAQTYEDSKLAKWAEISGKGLTEDGMYEYDAQMGTVTITKYVGQETEVVIPEEVVYRSKILLGDGAFSDTSVTSVTLSDNVENVGFHAFHGCVDLQEVILGEGVTTIDTCAFFNCSSLESIEIPPSVSVIASDAFKGTAVTSIAVKSGCEAEGLLRDWSEPITVTYYN